MMRRIGKFLGVPYDWRGARPWLDGDLTDPKGHIWEFASGANELPFSE